MIAIAVADRNWGIGKDGKLLVHLPGDLKYFKEKTLGKAVIMGRETLESLPGRKPLPGRTTIVLTQNPDYETSCLKAASLEECKRLLQAWNEEDIYVAGGESVYRQLMPWCDVCLITRLDRAFDADRFFPDLDADPDFRQVWESPKQEENGVSYRFTEYRKEIDG